jgi:hypothetical protein
MTHSWQLSETEATRLAELEKVVEANIKGYYEAGVALLAIRNERLYRRDFEAFDEYCRDKWGMSRIRAHQLIEAAGIVSDVLTIVNTAPRNEAQARELGKVPSEKRAEAWQRAVDTAPDGGITAQHVRNTVRPYTGDLYPRPVERPVKGFPSEGHKRAAIELILKTREPRGTIAKFLGVHDSVVSNVIYLDTATRSTLDEQREQAYLAAGRLIGMSDSDTKAWLAGQQREVV